MKSQSEIIENIVAIGKAKIGLISSRRGQRRVIILAIMAGLYIGLGGLLSVVASAGFVYNPSLQKICSGMAFPIGLMLTVFFGAELFTGNCAVLIPAYRVKDIRFVDILKQWGLVWVANFIGALLALLIFEYGSEIFRAEPFHSSIIKIAETKANLPFSLTFVRGIGANWFVCVAIWLALLTDSMAAKIVAIWIPIAAFVMLGYEHSVANMFFIPAGMLEGADVGIFQLISNLIAATLGNIVGGALLVGAVQSKLWLKRGK